MADAPQPTDILNADRVPVARTVRMRRLRLRALPVLCFVASIAAWMALWNTQAQSVNGIGRVSTLRIDIMSPASGLIARMPHNTRLQWSLFDHVRENDVIAEYDDSEWVAGKAQFNHDAATLEREFAAWREFNAKDLPEAVATQLAQLQQSEIDSIKQLVEQVEQGAEAQRVATVESLEPPTLPNEVSPAAREHFTELRNERQLLAIRALQLRNQADTLLVRAPISGTLVDVFCSPGQRLHAGAPIATLAADHGSHIVSYLPEATRLEPFPGMRVTIRSRNVGAAAVETEIEEVGRQIETMPTSLASNPTMPEKGVPIRIALPAEVNLQPGALVDIIYHVDTAM
jgi:multidrug resistance efflux pump